MLEYIRPASQPITMALGKRKRVPAARAVRTAMRVGNWKSLARASRVRRISKLPGVKFISARVNALSRMIETKEGTFTSPANVALQHNNIYVVQTSTGGDLNPLATGQSSGDPMAANTGARIGDRVSIRGLLIRGFLESHLNRSKVYFRIMLVKCPRGQNPTIANNLFKGASGNRMIDQVNTEKFTIVWQKIFNLQPANNGPASVNADGSVATGSPAGQATRTFKAWIPGSKLTRGGHLQYENGTAQPKFFDYRIAILVYDWYGSPETVLGVPNNVGRLNELYTKMYFKDA